MFYSDEEYQIFGRQFILKNFSEKNMKILANSNITIVGMGGIGCPVATYLVSSGIKNIKYHSDYKNDPLVGELLLMANIDVVAI